MQQNEQPATQVRSDSKPKPPGFDRRRFLQGIGAGALALGVAEPHSASAAPATLTAQQEASRFLAQAAFGGDAALIDQVASAGINNWLESQLAQPNAPFLPDVLAWIEDDLYPEEENRFFDWLWWQRVLTGNDLIRQRVAFVLSQIFVVSKTVEEIFDNSLAASAYWDVLASNAFGNFRDLLLEVTLQPSMGIYLSHLHNRRSDPSQNRFPDENFAREVMQLFSIGLFELNPDGSRKVDASGKPIPTYTNAEITEFAKIFTGLAMTPEPGGVVMFGVEQGTFHFPMVMYEPEHEPGPKTLLGGTVVPAGQTGMQDIEAAIDNLFHHPNVGPFLAQHLIRFLVTSNPTPAYVSRVSAAFDDNGNGVRGDMKAVLRAVLLDTEARDPSWISDPQFGKVREPFVRWVQLGRAFHATSDSGMYRHMGISETGEDPDLESVFLAQYPLFAPSVFNFFLPDHQPAGPLTQAGLVAPELQIINDSTAISTVNALQRAIEQGVYIFDHEDGAVWLDLSGEIDLVETDLEAFLDHLDLLFTYGTLSAGTRTIVRDAILPLVNQAEDQALLAIYLMALSPDYAVQR